MSRRAPTIQDVARLAGVSTATVSRALADPERVSPTARRRVEAAVAETGYRANFTARNLRQRRAGAILILAPNLGNPFFSRIVAAATEAAAEAGLTTIVADSAAERRRRGRALGAVGEGRADGVLLLDGAVAAGEVAACPAPVVTACEWIDGSAAPGVRVDNAAGARLAVRHLVARGHRRIGHLSGPPDNVLSDARRAGFDLACAEAGLSPPPEWIFAGDFSLSGGAAAACDWLAAADRPEAVFCANDESALGFVSELRRAGVEVPRDVSVVGFDDIDFAERFVPALTTIRQPRAEIGRLAVRLLIETLEGEALAAERVVLPVELVERESVGPPPAR